MRKRKHKHPREWFRNAVYHYLGGECNYCGDKKKLRAHHIIPVRAGGNDTLANLELVCDSCHHKIHMFLDKIYPKSKKTVCGTKQQFLEGCRCEDCWAAFMEDRRKKKNIYKNKK